MTYDGRALTTASDMNGLVAFIEEIKKAAHMHRPVALAADKNLILWTASPAPTPGGSDVLYAAHEYTYFGLNPDTGDVTVTLPDPTLMDWPLTFINNGVNGDDVVFESQQSPSVRTDGVTANDLALDGFKLDQYASCTIAPSKNLVGEWDLLWHDMFYEKLITDSDSPYTTLWWERNIRADATGGTITVNITAVLKGLPWTTFVKKTDAGGNAVTVEGTVLAAQGDVVGHRYSPGAGAQDPLMKP